MLIKLITMFLAPPDEVRITYHYQRQFAARPDNLTQDPWKTVIPRKC
jgi:hypothetical protein